MVNWVQVLNPPSGTETSSLFQSSSLSVKMFFEPLPDESMPHIGVIQKIKDTHNIVRGQWSRAKLVVMKDDQASPVLYLGGVCADGPLVMADLSAVTLRNVLADRLTDKFCFAFVGSAKVDDVYGAKHTAEFLVSFDTEAAFWAFALLMHETHTQIYDFFRFSGIRYRDQAVDVAPLYEDPIGPMQGWSREQALLGGVIFGLLPSFLKFVSLLFVLFLSAI